MVRSGTDYAWKFIWLCFAAKILPPIYAVLCISFSYCKVSLVFHVAARYLKAARCMWQNASSWYLCQVHSLMLHLFQIRYAGAADSSVQFIFYQPIIHRWRETDFFPCSASCGGGNELPLYSRNRHLHTGSVPTAALRFEPLKCAKSENESSYL